MNSPITTYQLHQMNTESRVSYITRLHSVAILASEQQNQLKIEQILFLLNKSLKRDNCNENTLRMSQQLNAIYSQLLYCNQQKQFQLLKKQFIKLQQAWKSIS